LTEPKNIVVIYATGCNPQRINIGSSEYVQSNLGMTVNNELELKMSWPTLRFSPNPSLEELRRTRWKLVHIIVTSNCIIVNDKLEVVVNNELGMWDPRRLITL
jgi:hypothetical protein